MTAESETRRLNEKWLEAHVLMNLPGGLEFLYCTGEDRLIDIYSELLSVGSQRACSYISSFGMDTTPQRL